MNPEQRISLENTGEIVRLLIENELLLARLYQIYAVKFPAASKFWAELSVEEKGHASHLGLLQLKTEAGLYKPNVERWQMEALLRSLDNARFHIHEAETNEQTLKEAFDIAVRMESSLVERDFFKIIDDSSDEAKRVMRLLHGATENHVSRLRKYWEDHFRDKK